MATKLNALGFQRIQAASLATATALTVPTGANRALIQAITANVRWRDDGTDPTAAAGMQLVAGASMDYDGELSTIKFILESGSPELLISYYQDS